MTGVSWKDRFRRLTTMSPEEVAVRAGQQISARADWLRYISGIGFDHELRKAEFQHQPAFFFSPATVPQLCSLLQKRLPEQAAAIIGQAERICEHKVDLLGFEDLHLGEEIDWHRDYVHQRRAPLLPWFKVAYLNFAEVGDSKITWELNRHQHLVTLAKAYRLSGKEKFAAEIFRQWRHWHEKNPYPIGVNWASSLEVAFRSLSWLWMYFLLSGTPALPKEFRAEWLHALGASGRHIECYLSTYFSPNTHLLGEGVALFFIGTLCPELRRAKRWKEIGWGIVLRAASRQVQADGLHFEQSVYYHVYALDFFLHTRILASANGTSIPAEFDGALQKMLGALCLLGRAGAPPRLGDDDGGRLLDPTRNHAEHMLDPLAASAILYQRGDFKFIARGLREETLWLLGERGITDFDRLQEQPPTGDSIALQSSGLYLMAGANSARQIVVDAGPQGATPAGHGHADALSLCVNSKGRALLIDPGTFEYVGDGPERNQFRGTAAHNTLQVDEVDQSEPKGPFSWGRLPTVKVEEWVGGERFDLFVGSHDGYSRLERPVLHRRWVFSLKSSFWFVRDLALGEGEHKLDIFWHLGPALSPQVADERLFLDQTGREGLAVLPAREHGWSREVQQGSWSPVYGRKEHLPVLHFSRVATLPAEFVTLFVAHSGLPLGDLHQIGQAASQELVRGYRYVTAEEEHCLLFAKNDSPWTLGQVSSDAQFLYWGGGRQGELRTMILCKGSYVEVAGQGIVSSAKRVSRCEILWSGDQTTVSCADQAAVEVQQPIARVAFDADPVLMTPGGSGRTKP